MSNSIKSYFTRIDAVASRCKLCHSSLKHYGNTTNLRNHMNRKHSTILASVSNSDNGFDTSKHKQKKLRLNKTATSTLNIDLEEEDDKLENKEIGSNSKQDMDANLCISSATTVTLNESPESPLSTCSTKQPKIDGIFEGISSFLGGGKNWSKLTSIIVYMVSVDCLPLSFIENKGFRSLLKTLVPYYKPPSRKTITKMINEKYDVLSLQFKEKFRTMSDLTITTDIWTDILNTRSFIGYTVHFCDELLSLNSVIIGVYMLEKNHTSEYISEQMKSTCEQWNIDLNNVSAIVTDNGQNMVKASYSTFGKRKHLPCFAHTLNLIVQNSLKPLKPIIAKVKEIVTFFKHSVVASDQLRMVQIQAGKTDSTALKLCQECETRWNSTYIMLSRFVQLSNHISSILLNYRKPTMLSHDEMETVRDMIQILKPFHSITLEICGEKFVTSSKVIPIVHCLKLSMQKNLGTTESGNILVQNLLSEIDKRFYSENSFIEKNEMLAIATILDPRYKKIHFDSPVALANALSKISDLLHSTTERTEVTNQNEVPPMEPTDVWNVHESLVQSNKENFVERAGGIPVELKQYLDQPTIVRTEDPLKYWFKIKLAFPTLYKLAVKYLSIVATSVPCERLFSKTGNIVTEKRNRIKAKQLSSLLFLNGLEDQYWPDIK